ncbi:hypothetical protein [Azotobacter vinelandii]|uniref:hypothetical protein n=1 Tax=Azotobacter vinelandii TaxID=354 RepID=UPI0026650E3F|nr:hypothetical protein [Azotobacter vinelandii]WKN20789.1 hypothetical protein AVAEIV_003814 [Azotobacter vinelandii]
MIDWGKVQTADDKATVEREATIALTVSAVQAHLDAEARALGYDDIRSAVTYADEPAVPKFQAEGIAFRSWRSLCWDYCYAQLAAVDAGEREAPTAAQLVSELPALEIDYGDET